jgi:hypothetical protein
MKQVNRKNQPIVSLITTNMMGEKAGCHGREPFSQSFYISN